MEGRLAERVLTLERQLAGMQAELLTSSARVAEPGNTHQLRIARISGDVSSTDNVFPIIFLDGTFTETAGTQSATWEDRQTEARSVARTIDGENIEAGTKVVVMAWNDRWWIVSSVATVGGNDIIVCKASEDIEHNAYGTVQLQETISDNFYDDSLDDAGTSVEVYNPLAKVWNNSRMLVSKATLEGTDDAYNIVQAWSATRIRGVAVGDIDAGSFGTVNDLKTIDGHYSASTLTAYLHTVSVNVAAGAVVWCELRWNDSTSQSVWEIYSADCG